MAISKSDAAQRTYCSLGDLFGESARRHAERPALFASGRYWSYRELDSQCRAIEKMLGDLGLIGQSRNIGLVYARGVFSYAAIIAILRSDNVYVPLNTKMPAEKLQGILQDAGIHTLIVDTGEELPQGVLELLRQPGFLQILIPQQSDSGSSIEATIEGSPARVYRVPADGSREVAGDPKLPVRAAGLAYIIYTSGSTGSPKGVAITHDSACRCIDKAHRLFGTDERDRFSEFSALSFDVSILDLFLCWKSGGTLYVAAAAEALVPLAFVVRHAITVWSSVPSLANFLAKLKLLKANALASVRLFLFCGEALPIELARACRLAAPGARVFNLYGPTECTIFATCHEYDELRDQQYTTVPIGTALQGLRHRIVDDGGVVDTEETPGELWLSGDQLASGYWNNPVATSAAFVSTPVKGSQPDVWYRTGDLVSYHGSVGLVFRGRIDRQVKLRGYRIELQEVEALLREVIGCTVVAVVAVRNAGGICENIIACCDDLSTDEAVIKLRCLSRMPSYMIPDRIVQLDTFPLNDSGKINYLALAARLTSFPTEGQADAAANGR